MTARAYFRSALHDWDDDNCCTILKHNRDAMKPGYSKSPDLDQRVQHFAEGCSVFATHSDFVAVINAAIERTNGNILSTCL